MTDAVPASSLTSLLQQGMAHHEAGRLEEAYACYAAVLDRAPQHADALHLAGAVRIAQGHPGEGVARVREAVGLLPEFPQAWNTLGLGLKAQGAFAEAVACLERAATQLPDDPYILCNLGGALWDAGKLAEAEAVLAHARNLAPQLIEAQLALGRIALMLAHGELALACYDAALAIRPGDPHTQAGRGAALLLVGQPRAALAALRGAVAAAPADPGARTDLARALAATGELAAAEAELRTALADEPGFRAARLQLGIVLERRGERAAALACLRALAADAPDFAPAVIALAVTEAAEGLWAEALAGFERAVRLVPSDPALQMGRASTLQMLGRGREAARACRAALALSPDLPEAHASLGVILQELGELEEAVASHRRALSLRPELVDGRCSLSHALRDLGQLDEAEAQARLALGQLPDRGFAHAALGFALLAKGETAAAEASLQRAVELPPDGPEQVCGIGMINLLLGDYEAGFQGFEARWLRPAMAKNPIRTAGPLWTGAETIEGRTVLLYCEQGLGDTLQMLRFVPAVLARGARVKLAIQPALARLVPTRDGAWDGAWDGVELVPLDQGVPAFDLHCPLLGLPAALGVTLTALPGAEMPYLRADPALVAAWAARLASPAEGASLLFRRAPSAPMLRVGLAWSGNPGHANDRNRSLPLAALAPLLAVAGCEFHVVQRDARQEDAAALAVASASGGPLIDQRTALGDFADTAALMAGLDLVISVDTAAAHLAGALGCRLWLLLPAVPDWRWLLGRDDSPWYPTARLFRQPVAGGWDEVIARLAAALSVKVAAWRAARPGGGR